MFYETFQFLSFFDGKSYDQTIIDELLHRAARPEDDFREDNVLREEVQKAVDRLKNNKSPGVDGIQAELVKAGGESTVDAIHRLCNMVWEQERWPMEWTSSILVTIAKEIIPTAQIIEPSHSSRMSAKCFCLLF